MCDFPQVMKKRTQSMFHRPKQLQPWAREYLPGYTGHVPLKNDLFGKTAGHINRQIVDARGLEANLARMQFEESQSSNIVLPSFQKKQKTVFGNRSRFSKHWIAGPTHEIKRQHIPGYTGHMRGMVNRDQY